MTLFCGMTVAQSPLEKAVVMPLKDVRPGMRGKIYTVFKGSNIESFNAEVVGVLDNFIGPGIDLILCKLPDAKTWNSGAVAGMSGSPMYIDGKLVGALGYGLQIFETERFCGVTPIEPMLEVLKFDQAAQTARSSLPRCTTVQLASGKTADFSGLKRLAIPLSVAGIPPDLLTLYHPFFERFGLEPQQGAGGAGQTGVEKRIEAPFIPGAAVSGVLIRGDMNMAGTGTLTYRDGNRVLGFGHPFFGIGEIEIPMAQAEIVTILPSLLRSFKVANVRQNIGTITQDRLPAIGGIVGAAPAGIPVTITAQNAQGRSKTYTYEVSRVENITPMLLSMVMASTMLQVTDYSEEFTMQVSGEAVFEGKPPLVLSNTYSGQGYDRLLMVFDNSFKIATILANPYEKSRLQSLHLAMITSTTRKTSALESLSVDKQIVRPGDTVEITYTIRPWRAAPQTRRAKVKIPEEVKSGSLELQICDAGVVNQSFFFLSPMMFFSHDDLDLSAKLAKSLSPFELFARGENPVTTRQIIDVFNQEVPRNAYYLRLLQNAPGVVVEDRVSENLPHSIVSIYQDSKINQPVTFINQTELLRTPLPEDGVALGSKSVILQVLPRR